MAKSEKDRKRELADALKMERALAKRSLDFSQIKPEKSRDGQRTVWKDPVNNRTYGRILGGIAWPGADSYVPDCHLAILGEDERQDVSTGQNFVWILCEEAERTLEGILDKACSLMEQLLCRDWILPMQEPEYVRVNTWLKDRRSRRMAIPHFSAPPVKEFIQLNALMQARTTTAKTFFFGEDSIAATAYVAVPDEDFYRPLRRYPQVACVLYPLGYLDTISRPTMKRKEYRSAEGGY